MAIAMSNVQPKIPFTMYYHTYCISNQPREKQQVNAEYDAPNDQKVSCQNHNKTNQKVEPVLLRRLHHRLTRPAPEQMCHIISLLTSLHFCLRLNSPNCITLLLESKYLCNEIQQRDREEFVWQGKDICRFKYLHVGLLDERLNPDTHPHQSACPQILLISKTFNESKSTSFLKVIYIMFLLQIGLTQVM